MANKAFMITDKVNNANGIVSTVDENTVQINWDDEREDTLTNDELEGLLESEDYMVEEVELTEEDAATPAQATIKAHTSTTAPGSEADGNPKTRIDWIKMVIGDLASASEESIEAAHFAMQQAQVGGAAEHATDGKVDSNRSTITMKPSSAVGHGFVKTEQDALFGETGLTEDAQTKISTLFEAAVQAAVVEEAAKLEIQYNEAVDAEIANLSEALETKVASFMDAVVAEWLEENKVAVESTLRTELTNEFIGKLHALFVESYIDVAEDKVDVLEAIVVENKTLEEKVNKVMSEKIALSEQIKTLTKAVEVAKLSEGLTMPKKAQLAKLVETVDFVSAEEFGKKVAVLKEGFLKETTPASNILTETAPVVTEEPKKISSDPRISAAAAKI